MPATVEQLQRVPLFADLSQGELQSLASSFKERVFDAGSTVVGEGSGGVGFFIIDEGDATVTVGGEERATLGAGQYFGELALIDDEPRSASVTAATEVTVYAMTRWDFRAFVDENAEIAAGLRQVMAKRQGTES